MAKIRIGGSSKATRGVMPANSPYGLAIGITVGAIVLLVFALIIFLVIWNKYKSKKKDKQDTIEEKEVHGEQRGNTDGPMYGFRSEAPIETEIEKNIEEPPKYGFKNLTSADDEIVKMPYYERVNSKFDPETSSNDSDMEKGAEEVVMGPPPKYDLINIDLNSEHDSKEIDTQSQTSQTNGDKQAYIETTKL